MQLGGCSLARCQWVGGGGSSSDSRFTVEKGIEILISTLAVGDAGGELFDILAWGVGCSVGGSGFTVGEGDETGERNEKIGVAH